MSIAQYLDGTITEPKFIKSIVPEGGERILNVYYNKGTKEIVIDPEESDMVELRFKPGDVGIVPDGSVTNVKVAAGAAIDMSKLTLAITNTEVAEAAGIAKDKLAALNIVNADVDAAAAIVKTKLAALEIANADVAAAAAIDMSKLTLAITDSEVAAAAGIAKDKLAALAIVDSDVDAAAAIAKSKLAALAIVNADVDAAAAIEKSKLEALAIVDGDVSDITVTKITGAVDGRAASTTGDKGITAIGFDAVTEEVVIDREE